MRVWARDDVFVDLLKHAFEVCAAAAVAANANGTLSGSSGVPFVVDDFASKHMSLSFRAEFSIGLRVRSSALLS